MPLLTPPPAAPQRGDRTTFAQRVDAFITWLINFVSELVGLVANLNSVAAGGAYALTYTVDTSSTEASPPGPGKMRFSTATQSATAALYFDAKELSGSDVAGILSTFDDSSSTVKGQLRLVKLNDPSRYMVFNVTSLALGGFRNIGVSLIANSHSSPFANGDSVLVYFQRTGDKGDTGVMGVLPRAKFREQRASGTSAGIAVNGANTRDLNTTEFNSISGASLAASSVTLPAGTYDFQGWAMRYSSGSGLGGHKAYLHNVTDNTTVSFGSSGSIGTLGINDRSLVSGRFTIAAAKTFQLRHYIEATSGSGQSLGFASSSGFAEVYSEIEFLKVA